MSETSPRQGTDVESEADGRNGHESDNPAEFTSGLQWADELDVAPETPIAQVVGADAWKAVRKFNRQHQIENAYFGDDGMSFADLTTVPMNICTRAVPPIKLTRAEVAAFAEDTMAEDPHAIGERLKRERRARYRERERTQRELSAKGIPAATKYTYEAVAEVDPQAAAKARDLVDRANRRAWNTPKPHSLREHEPLITADELYRQLGVSGADIARMHPATDADVDRALDALNVARIRHRENATRQARAGDMPGLDLETETLSMSALTALEPVAPLIDGFLFRGQLAELVGKPGSGKTFAALSMALSVASGARWCGHGVPSAAPVIYVAAEGASGIRARVLAWCQTKGIDPDSLEERFHVVPRAVQMGEDDHIAQVLALVKRTGAALVVFDTLARCTAGLEENSATDQGKAIQRADMINQQTGAAVLVVHHTAVHSERPRGSSAWDGALYSLLSITRGREDITITCDKHKDAASGCDHSFTLEPHTVSVTLMPGTSDAQRSTLVLTAVDPWTVDGADTGTTWTEDVILAIVGNNGGLIGLTRSEIVTFAKEQDIGRSSAYAAVATLSADPDHGRLQNVGDKRTPRFVVRPKAPADAVDGTETAADTDAGL